jgi:hypothetical protein
MGLLSSYFVTTRVGYDTMSLGNHDFDFRPEGVANTLRIARTKRWRLPVMAASNVAFIPDGKGDGIPEMPLHYRQPEGRFSAMPSWNPIGFVAGGNAITWEAPGIAVLTILLAAVADPACLPLPPPGSQKGLTGDTLFSGFILRSA